MSNENGLLGSRYKKAVYREYTDGTFKTPKARTNGDEHLGILGKESCKGYIFCSHSTGTWTPVVKGCNLKASHILRHLLCVQ